MPFNFSGNTLNGNKVGNTGVDQYTTNAILLPGSAGAFGGPRFATTANMQKGGQLGIGPRVVTMDGGTPLALNCAHVYVLQMPKFWDRFPAAQQMYKSYIELNAKSIDGIDLNYTLEFGDVEIGHDGQTASMPLKTKRAAVSPSVTLNEGQGNTFWNLNYMWLKHISHPDTCASLLSAMYEEDLEQWVWSTFSMTWLVIQPDPTGLPSRMVDAAVITNIIPTETGNLGIKRQIGSAEVATRTVSYRGIITHNESTRELGRLMIETIGAHRPNLDYALTWDGVRANISKFGHQGWMETAISDGLLAGDGSSMEKSQNNRVNIVNDANINLSSGAYNQNSDGDKAMTGGSIL